MRSPIKSTIDTLVSGLRLSGAFLLAGIVFAPVLLWVKGRSADEAATFLIVPLALVYLLWRTSRAFVSPSGSEIKADEKEAAEQAPVSLVLMAFVLLCFLVGMSLAALSVASGLVYRMLEMGWATSMAYSFAKQMLMGSAGFAIICAFIAIAHTYPETAKKAAFWFVVTPSKVRTLIEHRFPSSHAHAHHA